MKPKTFFHNFLLPEVMLDGMLDKPSELFLYYRDAGLVSPWTRPYFYDLYSTFLAGIQSLFITHPSPICVIDLGCGVGTTGIFCALNSIPYHGFDICRSSLGIAGKRSSELGKVVNGLASYLSPTFSCLDCTNLDAIAQVVDFSDALVVSQFAFNMMDPLTSHLLERILSYGVRGVVLLDGNPDYCLSSLLPASSHRCTKLSPGYVSSLLKSYPSFHLEVFPGAVLPKGSPSLLVGAARSMQDFWPLCASRSLLYLFSRH